MAKARRVKVVTTRRAAQGRIAPAPRFTADDLFVPAPKPSTVLGDGRVTGRAPGSSPGGANYIDERAAVLGSNNLEHPWACEPADDVTMAQLAKLAGTTVRDLQYRRNPRDPDCPERVPVTRARCWRCPFWARHPELTPFDGTPIHLEGATL